MYSHLVCSYIGPCKNLTVKNTKPKGKEKDKEMFKYLLFSFLSGAVFFHRLSIGLVLNRRNLAAAALYETYNIPIVKKHNRFVFFGT